MQLHFYTYFSNVEGLLLGEKVYVYKKEDKEAGMVHVSLDLKEYKVTRNLDALAIAFTAQKRKEEK